MGHWSLLLQGGHRHTQQTERQIEREMTSRIRQNYKEDCEALVNKQINMELYASYVYMSMASHFDRDDVANYGFSSYFKKNSDEEREHAEKFIKYQNRRGGRVVLQDIAKPSTMEWGTPLEAVEAALELEKTVRNYFSYHLYDACAQPHTTNILGESKSPGPAQRRRR